MHLQWQKPFPLQFKILSKSVDLHCKYTGLQLLSKRHFERDLVTNPQSCKNPVYLHLFCTILAYASTRVYTRMRVHDGPGFPLILFISIQFHSGRIKGISIHLDYISNRFSFQIQSDGMDWDWQIQFHRRVVCICASEGFTLDPLHSSNWVSLQVLYHSSI